MADISAVDVKWTSRVEFVVALLGYSIGMPEFWRVPYLTYRNGGGPFIIAYILLMLVCGLPLYFLELALSQYSGKGPWKFWDICPLLRGIGIAIAVINVLSAINTAIMEAWSFEYFVNSFKEVLPWTNCDNEWNTPACYREGSNTEPWNVSLYNITGNYSLTNWTTLYDKNNTIYHPRDSVDEFWLYRVLRISDGIDYLGTISLVYVAYLFVMRLLAAVTIVKSVETMGKVLYVTALLPIVLILMIWIRALTLPGATKGMLYFVSADFRRFADPQLWIEASFQTFITLGPGWGGLMMMGAHNKFKTNCFQSSVISTTATLTFGLLNGLVVFSVLGVMSEEIGVPIDDVMTSGGFSIGFIAYPKALSYFPLPQLWCAIFYLVLLLPGMDAMAILTEPFLMIVEEMFPKKLQNRRIPLLTVVSIGMFLVGLPFATQVLKISARTRRHDDVDVADDMAGKVYFDVGGTRFTTTLDTLQKIPGSRLEKLYEVHEQQPKSTGKAEYFFDRNPAVFGCVLDYHRTGVLHLPDSVCPSQIRLELEFWDISPHAVSSCCWKTLYGDEGLEKTLKILDREIPVFTTGKKFIQKTEGVMSLIRDLMEYPTSSMLAKAYAAFYLTMVVFSVICDALVRSQDYVAPQQQNANVSGSGSDHLMPSLSTIPCAGLVIEVLTNAVFTVDVVLRFAVSSSKVYFLKSFINILDMLALLGFWILVFTALISPIIVTGSDKNALMVGNLLMTLRFVRLYRLATINRGLKLVLLALDRSKKTIFLLFAIMIINSCVFGGIIYCVENNSEFIHVFRAFYWAIITMTTVGYGDLYPQSTVGRIVASLCAMTGLFLIAMPIGIISKNFTYLHSRFLQRERHCKEKRKFKKTIKFTSLPNGDASGMS